MINLIFFVDFFFAIFDRDWPREFFEKYLDKVESFERYVKKKHVVIFL